ncbi:MAG: hypothetical protein IJE43_07430 [Alphaproteobacteria bacterium]|nr:hypothetical protein [Alphaproteobacteria bacterium]
MLLLFCKIEHILYANLQQCCKELIILMELSHLELKILYDEFLDKNIKEEIKKFVCDLSKDIEIEYNTDKLWEIDFNIGGIGGYCMPANPVQNPFPAGVERKLYRPLQYARSEMDMCDVRIFARHVVQNAGLHLEAVCRVFLEERGNDLLLWNSGTTLGKAIRKIEKLGVFDEKLIEAMLLFVKMYNLSKHEVNQDESKQRLFNAYDAIVSYFVARVIGVEILKKVGREEALGLYKINK